MSQQSTFGNIRRRAPVIPTAECHKTGILGKGNEDEHFNALCGQATKALCMQIFPHIGGCKEVTPPFLPPLIGEGKPKPQETRSGFAPVAAVRHPRGARLRPYAMNLSHTSAPPRPQRGRDGATVPEAQDINVRSYAPIHPRHRAHSADETYHFRDLTKMIGPPRPQRGRDGTTTRRSYKPIHPRHHAHGASETALQRAESYTPTHPCGRDGAVHSAVKVRSTPNIHGVEQ